MDSGLRYSVQLKGMGQGFLLRNQRWSMLEVASWGRETIRLRRLLERADRVRCN